MELFSRLVRTGLYLWIAISIGMAVAFYWSYGAASAGHFGLGFFSNGLGASAVCSAIAAVGIWLMRRVYIEVKKRKFPDYDVARQTLLFLRKHHILFGWTTILLRQRTESTICCSTRIDK